MQGTTTGCASSNKVLGPNCDLIILITYDEPVTVPTVGYGPFTQHGTTQYGRVTKSSVSCTVALVWSLHQTRHR
jgi:hypothetical protein